MLEDSAGEVKGVAIEYGGFLGFGEKGAIVTLDQLKAKDGNLITDAHRGAASDAPGLERLSSKARIRQRAVPLWRRALCCVSQAFLSHKHHLAHL